MENIATPGASVALVLPPSATPAEILDFARQARADYEDACTSDGVTAKAWWSIAARLHSAAAELGTLVGRPEFPFTTRGVVQTIADRARDAEHRAQYAERMTRVAAMSRRQAIPVIDLVQAVAS